MDTLNGIRIRLTIILRNSFRLPIEMGDIVRLTFKWKILFN